MATVATEFYFLLNNQSWYTAVYQVPAELVMGGLDDDLGELKVLECRLNARRWLMSQPDLMQDHSSVDLIDWGVLNFLTDYRMDFFDMPRMSLRELVSVYG